MNKLMQLWNRLRSSFWFIPSLIVMVSIVFAVVLIQADSAGNDKLLYRWPRLFGAGAQGARDMMTTIAGSMMTVVGVTFSMILVVLTLVSSQYTSRILRNFIGSRVSQIVLGIFAGIFTYSLIVLRTIRSGDEGAFVPNIAVFFSFVLALGGVVALMFFINHIASSIQASSIIASVAQETTKVIDRLFPEKLGQEDEKADDAMLRSLEMRNWSSIPAGKDGYIQGVNNTELLRLARKMKSIIQMEHGIGDFVVRNTPLASVCINETPDEDTITALQASFTISRYRTVEQDVDFGIRQIVDVALKALSPGINDTTTAIMCVDYLTAVLARIAPRQIPSMYRYDEEKLCVIAKGPSFESLLAESFDQIRNNAKGNVAIMLRVLGALKTLASLTASPNRRQALSEQMQRIAELAGRTLDSTYDREKINIRLADVRIALATEPVLFYEAGRQEKVITEY